LDRPVSLTEAGFSSDGPEADHCAVASRGQLAVRELPKTLSLQGTVVTAIEKESG
jgi:hypothetical protein